MLMFFAMAGHTLSMVIGIPNSMFYLKIHKQKNSLINRYSCDMDQNYLSNGLYKWHNYLPYL